MAADGGALGLLDAAGAADVSTADTSTVESTVDSDVEVGAGEVGEGSEGAESTEVDAEGSAEESDEGGEEGEGSGEKPAASKDPLDDNKSLTPSHLRQVLKQFKSQIDTSTPEGKAQMKAIKELNDSYGRATAYAQVFPKMSDAKAASDLIRTNGGSVAEVQARFEAVAAVDQLLYNAGSDPESAKTLVSQIYDDLKSEQKTDAMPALASAFVESIKQNLGEEGYAQVALPVVSSALQSSGAVQAYNEIVRALQQGDLETAKTKVGALGGWFKHVLNSQKEPEVTPEAKKLADEKAAFAQERLTVAKTEVGKQTSADTISALGKAMSPYTKSTFFQKLSRPAKEHVAGTVMSKFYEYCKGSKDFQSRYKPLWATLTKNPNDSKARASIVALNKQAVDEFVGMSKGTHVRNIMADIYPEIGKPLTGAESRIAAQKANKAAATTTQASGKPVYVNEKPKNLERTYVKVGYKEYKDQDLRTLEISGKGFVKTPDGKGWRMITWRR